MADAIFTLWTKDDERWAVGATFQDLGEAEDGLAEWAAEFVSEFGHAPRQDRDFLFTMDVEPPASFFSAVNGCVETHERDLFSLPERQNQSL